MILCSIWDEWGKPIIQNVLGGWAFIILIKLFYYCWIWKFRGTYHHPDAIEANKKSFLVRLNILYVLVPIPNMKLAITLKNNSQFVEWKGIYYSDMLSMYFFRGLYDVRKMEDGKKGWHEIHLVKFKDGEITKRQIAIGIHFLKETVENGKKVKYWDNDGGYYIEKCH